VMANVRFAASWLLVLTDVVGNDRKALYRAAR
jgi:hypothetical protein